MAGLEGAHADEGYANTGGPKDGPVLTMMSKRLRALKKKFNRILQIEDNKAQGKTVNKEQEEVLKTKIAVAALIDEYEKLRQPLLIAVKEEVAEREKELLAATLEREDEEGSVTDEKVGVRPKEVGPALKEASAEEDEGNGIIEEEAPVEHSELANGFTNGVTELQEAEMVDSESQVQVEDQEEESLSSRGTATDARIGDLLTLLYFSQLFNVRLPGEMQSHVWTRVHERSSCLSYDLVGDDSTTPLIEADLDALAIFGSLLTSRPVNVTLSHKEALEKCVDHAKAWLAASESSIGGSSPELTVTYSGLRERLNRILGSEYFTMTPEITTVSQQTAAAAAAATAAGQYVTKVLVHEAPVVGSVAGERVIEEPVYHQDGAVPAQFFQPREFVPAVPVVVANGLAVPSPLMAVANSAPFVPETLGAAVDVVPQFGSTEDASQDSPDTDAVPESESESAQGLVQQAQPQNQNFHAGGPRNGGYQNPRGRHGYGGRGRGGGFQNGRGGRGRGGYPNGRSDRQFYDQGGQGGFYPRQNYYGGGGRAGRGPRGGGYNSYNAHSNGPAQAAMAAPPAAVAAGSS